MGRERLGEGSVSGPPKPPPGFVLDAPAGRGSLPPPPPGFRLDSPGGYLSGAESIGPTPWYDQGIGALVGMRGRGPSVRDALGLLPTLGGAVGGVVGGAGGTVGGMAVGGLPGAVGGAALGGAAGEAARQQIGDMIGIPKPQTAADRALEIGKEGAIQGAAELGGRGLAAGAKVLGKGMVENAVRPSMSIQREFPNVIDTIVKERLPVGTRPFGLGGAKGSERAALRLAEESSAVKGLLAKATAGGKTFETSKLAEPVLKLIDEVAEQPLAKADMKRLEAMINEFTSKKGPLSPLDVQKLKQKAQAIAKPIYKAVARGEAVSADQAISGRFNAALATGAKDAMETIPGVAEGEATKRELIGAKKALTAAETKRLSLSGEIGSAVIGAAAGQTFNVSLDNPLERSAAGWFIARGLLQPRALSRAGLALTTAEAAAMMKQAPRLATYLLRNAGRDRTGQPASTEGR